MCNKERTDVDLTRYQFMVPNNYNTYSNIINTVAKMMIGESHTKSAIIKQRRVQQNIKRKLTEKFNNDEIFVTTENVHYLSVVVRYWMHEVGAGTLAACFADCHCALRTSSAAWKAGTKSCMPLSYPPLFITSYSECGRPYVVPSTNYKHEKTKKC
ncbi:hypothetical protein Tcan_01175, partial [Toxocara canis]